MNHSPQVSLEQIDPTTLVIADNVRLDPRLDKQFLASIRERSVLEPVVAHRTADGTVVVEYGQRRTLAAREVGRAAVPVMVSDTAPTTADRLVDQWVDNEHRAALTNRERVHAVRELRTADDQPLDPDQHATDCSDHVTWVIIDCGVHYYGDDDHDDDLDNEDLNDEDLDGEATDQGRDDEAAQESEPEFPTRVVHGCTGWADHGHRDPYSYRHTTPATKAADLSEVE